MRFASLLRVIPTRCQVAVSDGPSAVTIASARLSIRAVNGIQLLYPEAQNAAYERRDCPALGKKGSDRYPERQAAIQQ